MAVLKEAKFTYGRELRGTNSKTEAELAFSVSRYGQYKKCSSIWVARHKYTAKADTVCMYREVESGVWHNCIRHPHELLG